MNTRSKAQKQIFSTQVGDCNPPSINMPHNNTSDDPLAGISMAEQEQFRVDRERIARQRAEWESVRLKLVEEINGMREDMVRMNVQVTQLRRENEQLRSMSARSETEQENGTGMLNGLVRGINSMNLNIRPPRFGKNLKVNPREFLEGVEKYFLIKKKRCRKTANY